MDTVVTPKRLSRALGVSESSVKRWCDQGEIQTHYTLGGHRRIAVSTIMALVREGKFALVAPEALGLPATSGHSSRVVERAREGLTGALLEGNESRCRQLIFDLFVAGQRPSVICDEVVAAAFADIGARWSCGEAEVYQERRACEIACHILREVQSRLAPVAEDGVLALGGAPAGDQYSLGTKMVELVLRDAQWNAVSLGNNLPFSTIEAAIADKRPKLFWLSCSHIADPQEFLTSYAALHKKFNTQVAFVVGGSALSCQLRQQMDYSAFCDNMQHLEGFARTMRLAIENRTSLHPSDLCAAQATK